MYILHLTFAGPHLRIKTPEADVFHHVLSLTNTNKNFHFPCLDAITEIASLHGKHELMTPYEI